MVKPITREEAKKLRSRTDVERLKRMTNDDIRRAAENDEDVPLLSKEELQEFQLASDRRKRNDKESK
ncbi:MAG: hypothetical protein ACR2PX_04900 [Endozoicomonas sp.]